jgi:flagellar motor switch protein FliG
MSTADIRKAAVLLRSLPPHQAADLVDQLDPAQMEALTLELAQNRPVTVAERWAVSREFVAATGAESSMATRPARTEATHVSPPAPLAALADVNSQVLFKALAPEHPQTIALVLAHRPATQAAQIVARLTPAVAQTVVRRMATIGPVNDDICAEVERELLRRVARLARR